MNATEAREIAEANGYKIAKRKFAKAVKEMEELIMRRAGNGFVSARIEIFNRGPWNSEGCTEKFKEHFESKGFEVSVFEVGRVTAISCCW